ncbi:hypothetical protein VR45_41125, partial [Streptomyces sp. NRRL S-495]
KTLPAEYAERLLEAQENGDEAEAQKVLAEYLQDEYFREGREGNAGEVEVSITDIDFIDVTLH